MSLKRWAVIGVSGIALTLTVGACSEDTLTESEWAQSLEEQGLDRETAECVAGETYGAYDDEKDASEEFDNEGEPSDEAKATLEEAIQTCSGGAAGGTEEESTEEESTEEESTDDTTEEESTEEESTDDTTEDTTTE